MMRASILIADAYAVARRGLRQLIEAHPGWEVVAEASTGREAAAKAGLLHPDVVILDLTLPELNGLDTSDLILEADPSARVLIQSAYHESELVEWAAHIGARGYVLKAEAESELITAVTALLNNKTYFPAIVRSLSGNACLPITRPQSTSGRDRTTLRERETLQLIAEGKSNKEAAVTLGISVRTVENHRARVMERLGLRSYSELVRYAIRNRMIEL